MKIFSIFAALLLLSIIRTQRSAAQQSQLDCSDKLDIFFALDASSSLTQEQFNQEKQLVINLLQLLIDNNRDAKAGYLTFTENVNNVRMLTNNIPILQFELGQVVFDSEGTSLFAPLNYVYNNIFDPSNTFLRPDSRKIYFQITDGKDEVSSESQLANISRRLFIESNVTTVAIGLGQLTDISQLNAIATDPNEQNVIFFSDFSEALGNVSEIFDRTCTIPRVEVVSAEKQSGSSIKVKWITYNFTTVNFYKICLKTDDQSISCNISVLNIDSSLNEKLVENLTPNTFYYITMFAFTTDLGVTPISVELLVATIDIPGPPLQLMSTAVTASSITISWVQPLQSISIDSYSICFSLSVGGSCAYEGSVSGSLEYSQTGLSHDTVYYIRVRAVNSGGTGNYSVEIMERTVFLDAPSLQSVQPVSYHQIDVSWNLYTTATVISYEICVRKNGTNDCQSNVTVLASATSVRISFLTAFTYYQVTIVAITSAGRSEESNPILVRTGEFNPGKPTNLTVISLSPSSIQVSWDPPSPNQQFGIIFRYQVCIRSETDESCLFNLIHLANATSLSLTHSSLIPNTLYRVRVRAENGAGLGSYSSETIITTDSLSAVTVTAAIESITNIMVTWTEVPIESSRISAAVIYLRTPNTSTQEFILSQSVALGRSYLILQVQPASMYFVAVVVNTTVGDTPISDEVIVYTQEVAPTGTPTITSINSTSNSVTLTWTSIPLMQQNGELLFYIIYYRASLDNSFTSIAVPASLSPLTYTITGLNPDASYIFHINGNNSAGNGPLTGPSTLRTEMLGQVENIDVVSTGRSITVTYSMYTEVVAVGYTVCLSTNSSGVCAQVGVVTGLSVTFNDLNPAQEYNVTVTAITVFGNSPPSPQQTIITLEEAPGAPSSVIASSTSAVSIQITTTPIPPDQLNGALQGYSICIRESNDPNCTFEQMFGVTSQSFTLNQTGLQPNTTYTIIVRGYNLAGLGTYNSVTVTTAPLQAVVVSVSVVDASRIRLYWTDTNAPYNYTIQAILYVTTSPSAVTPLFTLTMEQAQSKNITVEGLDPATTYYFVLKLVTIVGTTPPSDQVSGTTLETVPTGPPTNVRSEVISATSIKIIWSPPLTSDSNGIITLYTVCFGIEGQTCNETQVNASSTLEYISSDLIPETTYVFRVRAHTAIGPGPYSEIQNQTTLVPGGLVIEIIEAVNATTVYLSWNRLNITVSRYEVCVRETESGTCAYSIQINDETQVSTAVTGLQAYVMYYIVVTAVTPSGYAVISPVRSVRTLQLAPSSSPTQVIVVTVEDVSITIEWGEVPVNGTNGIITTYEVCVQLVANGPCILTTNVSAPIKEVVISGLTNNTLYIVTVRAYTVIGNGPYSPGLTIMTSQPRPEAPNVEVTSGSNSSIDITVTTPQTGAPITNYQICVTLPPETECVINRTIVSSANGINISISNLTTYTEYSVVVVVVGPGGMSESVPETITTQPGVPGAPVSGIQINSPSTTSLEVNWESLMQINWNDNWVGYIVQIMYAGDLISTERTFNLSVIFTGLTANTMYEITVTPFNSVGNGSTSSINGATQQEPPPSPEVDVLSGDTIQVTVNANQSTNASMPTSQYEICVKLSMSDACNQTIILPGGEYTTNVTGLLPNTNYTIIITVINTNNDTSPPSTPVVVMTDPLAPIDPVFNLQGEVTQLYEIQLTWEFTSSSQENAPTHFIVCLAEEENGSCNITMMVTADITTVSISEFEEETVYYVTVTAWNVGGYGPIAAIELTTPPRPPVDVTLEAMAVSPFEVFVEWETGDLNINIIHYSIRITAQDGSGDEQTRGNLSTESGAFVFSSLTPNTSYIINILELQIDKATTFAKTHPEGILNSPIRVQVIAISSQILRVTWDPSENDQVAIQQWEVCYDAETFTQSSGCDLGPGSENYLTIIDLEEYESYTITVRGVYNDGSVTNYSVPVTGRTEQDVPSRAVSEFRYVTEFGENKFTWSSPPLIHHNGIIVYYLVEFEYEENGEVKEIKSYVSPIEPEINIPYMVTLPYNVTVVPYTIGPGLALKIVNTDSQPNTAPAVCADYKVVITILCVILALLILLAIVLCCVMLVILFWKKDNSYSAV